MKLTAVKQNINNVGYALLVIREANDSVFFPVVSITMRKDIVDYIVSLINKDQPVKSKCETCKHCKEYVNKKDKRRPHRLCCPSDVKRREQETNTVPCHEPRKVPDPRNCIPLIRDSLTECNAQDIFSRVYPFNSDFYRISWLYIQFWVRFHVNL